MGDAISTVLPQVPWVARRPISVADYHRIGEAGIFAEDDRVELIEGELIAMVPIGSPHSGTLNRLNRGLVRAMGDRAIVAVQNPIRLDDFSEPQPDFSVLKPCADDYTGATPRPDEVLLVVEVAESSLTYDRRVKQLLYARHGIVELWIVNVRNGEIEGCRGPGKAGYASVVTMGRDAVLEIEALPGPTIPARDVVG